ncbi:unnamed protein product, partial [Effrenium voratum]
QARAGKAGPVAVKCIDLEAMTPQERRMAEQEAQLLRRIRHPHIVRFLDLVLSGDRMHLVMELMEGDLQQAIQTRREPPLRRFAEAVLWKWLAQLSGALAFLHQAQIIHRDVKPANVFLSKESVVLGDFGIAKVASFASTQIGTPGYLAPEVWLGRRYGPKSDIFSLGCSCFEALRALELGDGGERKWNELTHASALRPAFEGPTAEARCRGPARGLRGLKPGAEPPGAPGSDRRIRIVFQRRVEVRAMLQKQPQRRPGASEVLSLARFLAEFCTQSYPEVASDALEETMGRKARRRACWVLGASLAVWQASPWGHPCTVICEKAAVGAGPISPKPRVRRSKEREVLDGGEVVPPKKGHKHETATLIYLHGCSCSASQYLEDGWELPWVGKDRCPNLRTVLPDAKVTRQPWGEEEPSWHAYVKQSSNKVGDYHTLRETRDRLAHIVYSEVDRLHGQGHRVFLGGASQGCTVALDTYLLQARKLLLGGFVGSVGFMPNDHQGFHGATRALEKLIADPEQRQRPIWLQCATDDSEMVPWRSAVKPSLLRAENRLPGLYVKEVRGRGHILDEWEGEFVRDFLERHGKSLEHP